MIDPSQQPKLPESLIQSALAQQESEEYARKWLREVLLNHRAGLAPEYRESVRQRAYQSLSKAARDRLLREAHDSLGREECPCP